MWCIFRSEHCLVPSHNKKGSSQSGLCILGTHKSLVQERLRSFCYIYLFSLDSVSQSITVSQVMRRKNAHYAFNKPAIWIEWNCIGTYRSYINKIDRKTEASSRYTHTNGVGCHSQRANWHRPAIEVLLLVLKSMKFQAKEITNGRAIQWPIRALN